MFGRGVVRGVAAHGLADERLAHLQYALAHVAALQHLAALAVDDVALLVHHVVILQYVAADVVVAALHALLGVLDLLGDEAELNGLLAALGQPLQHRAEAVEPNRRIRSSSKEMKNCELPGSP